MFYLGLGLHTQDKEYIPAATRRTLDYVLVAFVIKDQYAGVLLFFLPNWTRTICCKVVPEVVTEVWVSHHLEIHPKASSNDVS